MVLPAKAFSPNLADHVKERPMIIQHAEDFSTVAIHPKAEAFGLSGSQKL
jgi:hypothetical protein